MSTFGGTQAPTVMPVPPPSPVMPGMNALFQQLFMGSGKAVGGAAGAGGAGGPSGIDFMVPKTGAGGAGGGGAAATSINALTDMASGVDIQPMIDTLVKSMKNQENVGLANVKNSFAASGMSMSSDLMKGLSDYETNFGAQQGQAVSNLIMQGKGLQLSAASTLEESFANAAMAYAPTGQVVGGAQDSNLGGALVQGGSSIGSTLIMLAALGFL